MSFWLMNFSEMQSNLVTLYIKYVCVIRRSSSTKSVWNARRPNDVLSSTIGMRAQKMKAADVLRYTYLLLRNERADENHA